MTLVRWLRRLCATRLGSKPRRAMTPVTCSTVSMAMPSRPLMTLETVETETPASAATCCMVTRPRVCGPDLRSSSVLAFTLDTSPAPAAPFSALHRTLQASDDAPLQREEQHEGRDHRERGERQYTSSVGRVLGREV